MTYPPFLAWVRTRAAVIAFRFGGGGVRAELILSAALTSIVAGFSAFLVLI